jgi:membrane fusion protein (multidrug efflux system)
VETARINLGFTRLTAPIDGITGIAQLQVGALVNPTSGALTTVSTVDPIKVYFTISEQEYLERKREYPTPEKFLEARARVQLDLILADGTTFPEKGKVDFVNRQVDVRTGAMRVAGIFPNPGNVLRPGEYGRVRAAVDIDRGALLVPQVAVFELQGTRELAVVGGDNRVRIRAVTLGDTVGHDWIVQEGVKPGERVVAEGVQKVRPGMLVDPAPFRER